MGQKEEVVRQKREEKKREAQVLLKIQAMSTSRQHLARLVPNAVDELNEVAFPDMKGMAINRVFLPQLLGQVQQEVQTLLRARQTVDDVVVGCVRDRSSVQSKALLGHRERRAARERKRYEEKQIRQGKIRILVDDGKGGKVPVGPIQISSQESVDEVQNRVYQWLQENEPNLASSWPCGVILCLEGEPMQSTMSIFEARAGQISMVPKPEPPAPEDQDEQDGDENGEGQGDEGADENEG